MEWREQSAVSCEEAFLEAQRWIEAVTEKKFGGDDFRSALENGVLLCDLINKIKPGVIRKVNRLPTPIAGLDNLNVFLKACGRLGLKEAQLFHSGDLQDLSTRVTVKDQETNRRLKNVLITIFWLGRRAQSDRFYDGPYLNFKAFEGLLGTALYKALQDSSSQKGSSVRDSGFGDGWYSEREELHQVRGEGGGVHRREDSLDSLDSLGSRPHSISSDATLKGGSEGCCSDTEADSGFKMAEKETGSYRRSVSITPKTSAPFNQFLPTKDKQSGYVPAPLRKKRGERNEDNRRSWANPSLSEEEATLTSSSSSFNSRETQPSEHSSLRMDHRRAVSYDSLFKEMYGDSEDEDDEVGYADPVQDDLYARKMGIKPQSPTIMSHDKFLPKFWTPEEDVHVQKIKLGSQRRPWYKKMQGFSYKKSGSSSDDSDCDISPWLSSAPPHSGSAPSHPHTHEASAHTTLVVGKSEQQMQESIDGSKSTSDILVDTTALRQARYEELQKYREKTKESDDKWQDDLSKWKNRRRSVNSDIVKKKEEREKLDQITHSSSTRRSKTFSEMQEGRENKRQNSVGSRLKSLSYLDDDEDVFEKPVTSPRTRSFPSRSYTIDTPYPSEPSLREEEPPAASPAPGRASSPPRSWGVDILDSPAGRDTTATITPTVTTNITPSPPPAAAPSPVSDYTSTVKTERTSTIFSSSSSQPKVLEPTRPVLRTQTAVEAPSSGSLYKRQPQISSMEPKPPAVSRVSASLPRSYQRPDSTRLTSVVAPRPFGTQSSRMTSLSRANTTDETRKPVNGGIDVSKKSSVPSRYHQFMTSEDETQSQSSSSQSSEDEEEEKADTPPKNVTSIKSVSPLPPQVKSVSPFKSDVPSVSPAPAKEASEENFCEMRICLNQKPNSSTDFGFQATWDSTGARITSIQPGSPAEMCKLQVGDKVLTVNRHQVADMSYTAWKTCMQEALQEGSLVVDLRRHGKISSPDSNLVSPSLDFTSRSSPEKLSSKDNPIIDVASNGFNGGFRDESVTMRNKESEPISLKNLKRRSEFFEKGGLESEMPDIPVPSIAPSSSRWSWDPEEERRRQEKWQKEQERVLQEKYKRDQEKLTEEWQKAQEEITNAQDQKEPLSLKVNSHSFSPHSPRSPASPAVSPPWEEEERKRKEEQERQRQEEERRKREQEEKELHRLQEERKRKEQQEEAERKSREEEELRWQRRREEEEKERRRQEILEQQFREKERVLELQQQQQQQQQWAAGSHGFVQPSLSFTDRAKSKSSPQLDEDEKPQRKGGHQGGMAQWLLGEQFRSTRDKQAQSEWAASELELERRDILNAMKYREPERVTPASGTLDRRSLQPSSQAEFERQQILTEMKKKTPLLTDNSWIRQRANEPPPNKDPDLPSMRRGESLDNLDSTYNSWRSSWTPRSNSHIPNYTRPHSALSGSLYQGWSGTQQSRASTLPSSSSMGSLRVGAGASSNPWSRQSTSPSFSSPSPTTSPEPQSEPGQLHLKSRSVSGKKICTFCDTPLGKGAAMIIESLGLCYHLGCFKCIDCKSDLGGSEAGAEVRIRNKQLYCNSCYMRFKTGQPTSM